MYDTPKFLNAGDAALVVEFGDAIDAETNREVHKLAGRLDKLSIPGLVELIPTYRSLLVSFDPMMTTYEDIHKAIADSDEENTDNIKSAARIVKIPTLYSEERGPDLEFVAENAGVTIDEVISIHSGTDYLVYMMGFAPGFPYLGGLDERLATPRLQSPRVEIAAGSVGIAEGQTGVYPITGPGGWRLVGRTPLLLFDPHTNPPTVINAGDFVRFVPMGSEEEYAEIERKVNSGEYTVSTEIKR
jgi:KipI family sensor histidine kinase inhibitor